MNRIAPAGPSRSVSAFHPSSRIWYADIEDDLLMVHSPDRVRAGPAVRPGPTAARDRRARRQDTKTAALSGRRSFGSRWVGGADRDRTDDLLNAIQALSQLSYSPTR